MKTYHNSNQNNQKQPKNKKGLIAVVASLALIIIALAIVLPITLSGNDNPQQVVPGPGPDLPSSTDPVTYVSPLEESSVTNEYSMDTLVHSATLKRWMTHNGVDFKAEKGSKVRAIADGKVESVTNTNLDGNVIVISHDNGLVSIYKSLGEDIPVEEGDTVKAGDVIGYVDVTMMTEMQDGAHLHLEMTLDGKQVNPMDYLSMGDEK